MSTSILKALPGKLVIKRQTPSILYALAQLEGQTLHRCKLYLHYHLTRQAPVLKTIFHQCVISNTCSQSNTNGSVRLATSIWYKTEPSQFDWLQVYDMTHWWKIVLRTGASLPFDLHYPKTREYSGKILLKKPNKINFCIFFSKMCPPNNKQSSLGLVSCIKWTGLFHFFLHNYTLMHYTLMHSWIYSCRIQSTEYDMIIGR